MYALFEGFCESCIVIYYINYYSIQFKDAIKKYLRYEESMIVEAELTDSWKDIFYVFNWRMYWSQVYWLSYTEIKI